MLRVAKPMTSSTAPTTPNQTEVVSAGGTLSLTSALVWRSQLIDAWRAERKRGQPNGAS